MTSRLSPEGILALEDARSRAMLSADFGALSALLADTVTYGHSSGSTDGKQDLLLKLQSGRLRFTELHLLEPTVRSTDCCALVTGRMQASVVIEGQPRSVDTAYLAVWAPEPAPDGLQWSLQAYQGTPFPR
jgi:hypothetical protein